MLICSLFSELKQAQRDYTVLEYPGAGDASPEGPLPSKVGVPWTNRTVGL